MRMGMLTRRRDERVAASGPPSSVPASARHALPETRRATYSNRQRKRPAGDVAWFRVPLFRVSTPLGGPLETPKCCCAGEVSPAVFKRQSERIPRVTITATVPVEAALNRAMPWGSFVAAPNAGRLPPVAARSAKSGPDLIRAALVLFGTECLRPIWQKGHT